MGHFIDLHYILQLLLDLEGFCNKFAVNLKFAFEYNFLFYLTAFSVLSISLVFIIVTRKYLGVLLNVPGSLLAGTLGVQVVGASIHQFWELLSDDFF